MSEFSSKDLAAFAAGIAAGILTEDAVMEVLGNDQSLMDEVMGMITGTSVAGVVSSTTRAVTDAPGISDALDAVDKLFDWD